MTRLICGLLRFDGLPADLGQLEDMLGAMRPATKATAVDSFQEGSLAMAVMAISTTSDSPPPAPTIVRSNGCLLAADVRLYGETNGSIDEERLAAAMIDADPAALAKLHGDFAFAHWNRATSRLTLGRDHFGARPIQYVVRKGEFIAFASLPTALLRTGLASRALDEASIASFPINEQPLPGRTYFRDIGNVRAAHVAIIEGSGQLRQQRYWRLPLEPLLPFETDPATAASEVRRLLQQAVSRRLPRTGPVGAHMSGGLDSTPIAVLAARGVRDQGRICLAYSLQEARTDADVPIIDEAPYVAEAAAGETNLEVNPVTFRSEFDVVMQGVDPDTMLPVACNDPEEAVLAHAASKGAGILLSGWGGDQIVTSYGAGWDAELLRAGRWAELAYKLKSRSQRSGRSRSRLVATLLLYMLMPPRLVPHFHRLRGHQQWMDNVKFIAKARRRLGRYEFRPCYPDSGANRRAEMEAWWIPYRLEMFAQQGARHGVAYAYPMLDMDLIRYVMRLPGIFFQHGDVSRALIRNAIQGIVPDSVRWREEKFVPFPVEALRVTRQRDAITEALRTLGEDSLVASFLDIDAVIAYVRSGRSEEQILKQMAADAEAGEQFTSEEQEHSGSLRLALFLKAQSDVRREAP